MSIITTIILIIFSQGVTILAVWIGYKISESKAILTPPVPLEEPFKPSDDVLAEMRGDTEDTFTEG